jgi:hypothetical protein
MSLKAALRIREQEAETDEPDTFVYVHRASYNIPFCPGLLDPSIKFNVG